MRKLFLFFFLAIPAPLFAQGAFTPIQTATKTVSGFLAPAPAATITVCAAGSIGTPCSPALTGTIFSDIALTIPKANPFLADSSGNYQFVAAPGTFTVTVTGTGVVGYSYQITISATTGPVNIAPNQVGFGVGTNSIGGSNNFQWNVNVMNALNLNMPGASCTGLGSNSHGCSLIALTNSSATTPFYIDKYADNSLCFTNDDNSIPIHGQTCFGSDGTMSFLSGAGGSQMQLHTSITTASGWTFPAGSVTFALPQTGVGQAQFALGTPGSASVAKIWDTGTGCDTWYPANSTSIKTTLCPPASGSTTVAQEFTGTSSAFATATTAGTCVQNTTAITGAATSMAVVVSPVTTPGVGAVWSAFVSSAGNVTINECAVATSTGGSIAFNIRVIL